MRTTLTIDDDIASLVEKENRSAREPMRHTINRLLRAGLVYTANPPKPKRFVVKPIDTGITPEQWAQWEGRKLEEIMDEAERSHRP